jgi:anti-sigma factor RsiW
MNQMTCGEIEGRLDAYLGDELEGRELRGVIEHLAQCPACRRRAEAVDPLKLFVPLAVREQEGGDRWDGFWDGIADKLEERPQRRVGRLIPWPRPARWVAAAGALAATVLVGFFLVQQGSGPGAGPDGSRADLAPVPIAIADDAGGLVEEMYIDQIAEALPARLIERHGEVRALRLTRVDERSSGSMNHYRAGGEAAPATVSDVQLAEQMESIIEYSLVIAEDAERGEAEEVRVVSFESEEFPFGCRAVQNPE